MLILGAPGTGKTNLLLELAQSLIAEAKRDDARPIPIVFSLSRWTLGKGVRTLAECLKDDLAAEYGLARATADALVWQDRILPLLDGLDEVAQDRRSACISATVGMIARAIRRSRPLRVAATVWAAFARLLKHYSQFCCSLPADRTE